MPASAPPASLSHSVFQQQAGTEKSYRQNSE
ncbi:hypothetical protein COLO4_19709 [Corchorus olitorius]|uniref:Uncharacterized protein n=1 Tax=Corchorus olitorius TaxID=93759 RepID=A0A1R3J3X6_9ROSI|nr:hypothetical protein COLO4_19709 [Corchorus olitorius]